MCFILGSVRVQSNSRRILHHPTAIVLLILRLVRQILFSEYLVSTGLMNIKSKTISLTVSLSPFPSKIEFKIVVLVWTNNDSQRLMIANSLTSTFQLRLPNVNRSNSFVNLNIHIRDRFDCFQQYNISDVRVQIDSTEIEDLFQVFKHSPSDITNNSLIQSLSIANQKNTQQILISTSRQFNQINAENLDRIASSKNNILFERIMFLIILSIQMIFL